MSEQKDSVKVAVRVRPINKSELAENATDIISIANNNVTISEPTTHTTKNFGFDYVFGKNSSNEDIYNSIGKDIVKSACAGYNCCILAYGQTGSGKTYTMLNYVKQNVLSDTVVKQNVLSDTVVKQNVLTDTVAKQNVLSDTVVKQNIGNNDISNLKEFGLIPHIASELLSIAKDAPPNIEYQIEVSFTEIYAEKIFDLLTDDLSNEKTSLKLHINPKIGTYIEGLNSIAVSSINQIMQLIAKGFKHRSTSSTAMNEQSSRSHAIFTIDFKQICYSPVLIDGQKKVISEKLSKIKLVDLAGSERVKTSKVSGVNFQEAIAINKSLSMLSTVINELVENGSSTKFRNSILTALLADSISGNSKTVIIANVSPASIQYDISLQTLFYVHRTKRITVHAKVNESITHDIVAELKAEIERLKSELLKITDPEEVAKLKEELAEYERLYQENSRSWSDKLKDSEESVSRLEYELNRRNTIITEHESSIQTLTLSYEQALSEKQKIEQEIKAFYKEKESLSEEIHNMQNEKTLLMCDKVTLNNEKNALLAEKLELMNAVHILADERNQLIKALEEMHHEQELLKIENLNMIENLNTLKIERRNLAEKMSRINSIFKPKN